MYSIGPDRAYKVQARVGLGLYTAGSGFRGHGLQKGRDRGQDCMLGPKSRPAHARAFGLCSKSLNPSPHVGLGPGPDLALVAWFSLHVGKRSNRVMTEGSPIIAWRDWTNHFSGQMRRKKTLHKGHTP
jgi:hypothetical protein